MGERVAIVGSRGFKVLERVEEYVRWLPDGTVVISGGAYGVDQAAARAARARGLEVVEILPQWGKYGRFAALHRNGEIAAACDRMVAFWDGKSRGTWDSILKARALGKRVDEKGPV